MKKQEIINYITEKTCEILGADPAYFGEEGLKEIEKQLNLLGYTLSQIREMEE